MNRKSGFTLLELLVTIGILVVLMGIAIPAFSTWLPNYRLKSAVMDIYSKCQHAKMMAVRTNRSHAVQFNTAGTGTVSVVDSKNNVFGDGDDDTLMSTNLSDYDDGAGNIQFNNGDAASPAGSGWDNFVTFSGDRLTFNSRGTCNAGYVYLSNARGTAYNIGAQSNTGLITMAKWKNGDWN